MKILSLLLLIPLSCMAEPTDEQMRLCEHLSEVYGVVYPEVESGVAPELVAKHAYKKFPGYTEDSIARIVYHSKMLMSTGYTVQRIMGLIEGKCVAEMSAPVEKPEDVPPPKPTRNGVIT